MYAAMDVWKNELRCCLFIGAGNVAAGIYGKRHLRRKGKLCSRFRVKGNMASWLLPWFDWKVFRKGQIVGELWQNVTVEWLFAVKVARSMISLCKCIYDISGKVCQFVTLIKHVKVRVLMGCVCVNNEHKWAQPLKMSDCYGITVCVVDKGFIYVNKFWDDACLY